MRQHQTISGGRLPFIISPLGILCIRDPFRDIRVESRTQVSCPHSILFVTMSPSVVSMV